MRLNNLLSFVGFAMLIAATWCPVLRPFHLFNMDVYDANKPYGIVILLVGIVGVVGCVFSQAKIVRLSAWLCMGLVILFYILAYLKVHTSFSFIPFHGLDAYLTRQIKFKWGWALLFLGPLLALGGVFFTKKSLYNRA